MCFNGAVEIDNALADRGEGGASAAAAAGLGGNSGLTQRMIDFLDQQPCPAVGHAEQSRARRDRSSRADRLQKRDLARPNVVSACEIDTNGKTWTGHGALAPGNARSQARFANLQFDLVDAIRLPYADASFGGAAAQLVLNFVPNPIEVLHEIQRVTVPGSPVVAAVWDFRGGLVYQRIFWDTAAGFDPGAAVARDKLFSGTLALPDGLPRLFESAGLDRVERTSITIRMDYASFDDYWKPLCGGQGPVGTYLASLAPDLRARIEEAVAWAYRSGAPDGPRSLAATAWAVRGEVR